MFCRQYSQILKAVIVVVLKTVNCPYYNVDLMLIPGLIYNSHSRCGYLCSVSWTIECQNSNSVVVVSNFTEKSFSRNIIYAHCYIMLLANMHVNRLFQFYMAIHSGELTNRQCHFSEYHIASKICMYILLIHINIPLNFLEVSYMLR